jgi:hypothetical protein
MNIGKALASGKSDVGAAASAGLGESTGTVGNVAVSGSLGGITAEGATGAAASVGAAGATGAAAAGVAGAGTAAAGAASATSGLAALAALAFYGGETINQIKSNKFHQVNVVGSTGLKTGEDKTFYKNVHIPRKQV